MQTSEQVKHPSLVDRVVEHVYRRIIAGELSPGQRLTEEQIAAESGVSRTPVREAVRRLAELGVVVIHPRARLEVASPEDGEIHEIAELREELEAMSLRLALPNMTDEDLAQLEAACDACRRHAEAGERLETFRADSEFHLALAALADNRYLHEALRRLDVKVQLCRAFACVEMDKIRRDVAGHGRILLALRRRDLAAAETAMRKHIRKATLTGQGDTP